ncbi:UNC5C (predicted) [Pycnogonum litorale]
MIVSLIVFALVINVGKNADLKDEEEMLLESLHSLGTIDTSSNIPVFLEQPKSTYVVKNKPATLSCIAANALQLHFRCNGERVASKQHSAHEYVDPMSGIRQMELKIDVSRRDVEQYFGVDGYGCRCYAWSSSGETISQRALINVAYLRKHFHNHPMSSNVALEGQILLTCLPPDGVPPPQVFWLKDGKLLDVKGDQNLIISSEGNLIVSLARLSDMGNYTCGAQNVATKRLSSTASLVVHVDGMWSSWSPWSTCDKGCGRGVKRRSRLCTNPTPLNGGEQCKGQTMQVSDCHHICPGVDGRWSSWSSWSTCGPDCKHHKRRTCSNPKPKNGGRYCSGRDLASSICSGGMCKAEGGWTTWSSWTLCSPDCTKNRKRKCIKPAKRRYCRGKSQMVVNCTEDLCIIGDKYYDQEVNPASENDGGVVHARMKTDVILYIGLIIAVTVFIAAVIVVVLLVRKKQQDQSIYEDPVSSLRDVRIMEPDLTQSVPNNLEVDSTSDGNKRNLSSFMGFHGSHHYSSVPSDSIAPSNAAFIRTTQMNIDGSVLRNSYSTVSDSSDSGVSSSDSQPPSTSAPMLNYLPSYVDPSCIVWADVGNSGAHLNIPGCGVSLTVPPGAIKKGISERVFVSVLRDDQDRPQLPGKFTMLGPVLQCGPAGFVFNKPVVLGFEHCCRIKQSEWNISLLSTESNNALTHSKWKRSLTIGDTDEKSHLYCHIDTSHCYLMTDALSRVVLVGSSAPGCRGTKTMRLLLFAPMLHTSEDYYIRIYCVQDTSEAIQGVSKIEERLGGWMLDETKLLNIVDEGSSLSICITDVGDGWTVTPNLQCQEIDFSHVWSGTQNYLSCSVILDHIDRSVQLITCKVTVNQKGQRTSRQVFSVRTKVNEKPSFSTFITQSNPISRQVIKNKDQSSIIPHLEPFRMSKAVRKKLCQYLDHPDAKGRDWKNLVKELGIDRQMDFFATKQSPTEQILDLWEARHREPLALTDLANILRVIGRNDAASVIEKQIGPWI